MQPEVLIVVAIVNLALLIWFIVTLMSIERNTKAIAAYMRSLALSHPPSEEQARVINRDLSLDEVLARLEARGARVRLLTLPPDTPSNTPSNMPPSLQVDNIGTADPEMLRVLHERRQDFIQLLLRRQGTGDA